MEFPAYFECEARVAPAAADAFHRIAAVLIQMLVVERGNGEWLDDLYEQLRAHLETHPMPEDQEGFIEASEWRETAVLALDNIIAHRLLVEDDDLDF